MAQKRTSTRNGQLFRIQTVIRYPSMTDLILSSGFLAFARHVGVLRALEKSGVTVDGVCGTSSGALVGALWAAGLDSSVIEERLSAQAPISMMRLHLQPWRGLFSMAAVVDQLREWLPPTFEDLDRPFGVGVVDTDGRGRVLHAGPLPEAVAASCAIPFVFMPICVDGLLFRDGGVVDRTALQPWRALRGHRPTLLHVVDRTGGAPIEADGIPEDVVVIRTRRSGARFWSLGDFTGQVSEAEQSALMVVAREG